MADTVADRRRLAADNFGYESTTDDWRQVIDRADVDVIDITAPNAMHEELATAAAAAGKARLLRETGRDRAEGDCRYRGRAPEPPGS